MLNILAYVRAKFKEAVLAGVQDALDEIDPVSSRPGPPDGDEPPAGAVPVLPTPPAPPALGAGKSAGGGGDGESEQEQPKASPSLTQQIAQAAAAVAANANSTALTHPPGPSAARRDRRPRGESGP